MLVEKVRAPGGVRRGVRGGFDILEQEKRVCMNCREKGIGKIMMQNTCIGGKGEGIRWDGWGSVLIL